MPTTETFYEVMRRQGIIRRSFIKFCSLTATALGLAPSFAGKIAHVMETKPRTPVLSLHGLECTCCSESFIRSAHPLVSDVVLSMISLDYDDLIMDSAGHQAEAILEEITHKYKGNYILAVEGNPPLNQEGMSCIIGGRPFLEQLQEVAKDCKAIISWGSCASWGCVQAARPNPTQATPIHEVIRDKPIIKVVHFYHLHAMDWVDVVSSLKADPKATSALAQSISDWPLSSPGYFRDVQTRIKRFVQ